MAPPLNFRRNADVDLRELERRAATGDMNALRQVVLIRLRTGMATLEWLAQGGPRLASVLPPELRRALVRALTADPAEPEEASLGNFMPAELAARRGSIGPYGPDPGPQDYERAFENAQALPPGPRHLVSDALLYGGGVTLELTGPGPDMLRMVREGYALWIQPESGQDEGYEPEEDDPPGMVRVGGYFPIKIRNSEASGLEVLIEGYEPILVPGTGE
jgi:hypothetical protein